MQKIFDLPSLLIISLAARIQRSEQCLVSGQRRVGICWYIAGTTTYERHRFIDGENRGSSVSLVCVPTNRNVCRGHQQSVEARGASDIRNVLHRSNKSGRGGRPPVSTEIIFNGIVVGT